VTQGERGYQLEQTQYGFRWGPLEVMRGWSDPKFGVGIIVWGIGSSSHRVEIRVSPKGQVLETREFLWSETPPEALQGVKP